MPGPAQSIKTPVNGFAGVDQRNPETKLAPGALREAQNVDIHRTGWVKRRVGFTAAGLSAGHSLWSHPALDYALYVTNAGSLTMVTPDLAAISLLSVSPNLYMSYVEYQGETYFSNGVDQGIINKFGAYQTWGVDRPPAPQITVTANNGTLCAGRYFAAVTVSYGDDSEESAPSSIVEIDDVAEGSSITAVLPASSAVTAVNLFLSDGNGEELFFQLSRDNTGNTVTLPKFTDGRVLEHIHYDRMLAGSPLAVLNRRILAARGRRVYYSAVDQRSIIDQRYHWLQFDSDVMFMGGVDDGVYVGTRTRTYFLTGADPDEFEMRVVDSDGVISQPQVQPFDGSFSVPEGVNPQGYAVAWCSNDGDIIIGRNGGLIQRMNQQLAIPPHLYSSIMLRTQNGEQALVVLLKEQSGNSPWRFSDAAVSTINNYTITEA